MSIFRLYFTEGIFHILNLSAYDHILFVTLLTAVYFLRQWKAILSLVTAFTIGHSISLALATLDIVTIAPKYIEFFIAITILLTAIEDLFLKTDRDFNPFSTTYWIKYGIALFFGLIHGLGFSETLRSMIGNHIALPLLSFNLGVEIGQIVVVLVALGTAYLFVEKWQVKHRDWTLVLSGMGIGATIIFIIERWPF
jgi:hypothetical protein